MQEEAYLSRRQNVPQHLRKHRQMVVVNPDQVAISVHILDGVREALVHSLGRKLRKINKQASKKEMYWVVRISRAFVVFALSLCFEGQFSWTNKHASSLSLSRPGWATSVSHTGCGIREYTTYVIYHKSLAGKWIHVYGGEYWCVFREPERVEKRFNFLSVSCICRSWKQRHHTLHGVCHMSQWVLTLHLRRRIPVCV